MYFKGNLNLEFLTYSYFTDQNCHICRRQHLQFLNSVSLTQETWRGWQQPTPGEEIKPVLWVWRQLVDICPSDDIYNLFFVFEF